MSPTAIKHSVSSRADTPPNPSPSPFGGLVHHSDRGVQYLSIRYTERLAEVGAVSSVGSRGDSYDNALAESVNGLYKAELVHRRGPWRGLEDLELATLEWVDWFNHRRLSSAIGYVPPAEYEASQYCESVPAPAGTQRTESPLNPGRFRLRSDDGKAGLDSLHIQKVRANLSAPRSLLLP